MGEETQSLERQHPPIGVALWLLRGGTVAERVAWAVAQGFTGLSLLQNAMDYPAKQREDAAHAMRQAGLNITYHANVHQRLTNEGQIDWPYVEQVLDDVRWWYERTGGIASCCIDPIYLRTAAGYGFCRESNRRMLHRMHERLAPLGIRIGIENGFGDARAFQSLEDMAGFAEYCALPELGLLFDTGHANIHLQQCGGMDIGAFVEQIPLDILEVHVSDNRGERDDHRQVGYGNLDLSSLMGGLRGRGYQRQITVEVCVDIHQGQYAADIHTPAETGPIVQTRDRIVDTWAALQECRPAAD